MFESIFGRRPRAAVTTPSNSSAARKSTSRVPSGENGSSPKQKPAPQLRSINGGPPHAPQGQPASTNARQEGLKEIANVGDLPTYKKVLTAQGGPFEVPEILRRDCVAIAADTGSVWLIMDREANAIPAKAAFFTQLRSDIRAAQWTIEKTAIAEKDLIAAIYESASRLNESVETFDLDSDGAKLLHEFVQYGYDNRASDIHFEIRGQQALVRFRIDNKVKTMRNSRNGVYTREQVRDAVGIAFNKFASDKTNSHSNFNEEVNLSCMIPYVIGQKSMNLRYQSVRAHAGYDVIVRYLIKGKNGSFDSLGYSADQIHMLRVAAGSPRRLFLICGITGSGKSTTLNAAIDAIPNKREKKIYTVEDPVEYDDPSITKISVQRTLQADSEKTPFREIEGTLMRGDPDVIMMGEIRDNETGMSAQTFIRTGHQVMATLHASSVFGAFDRLTAEDIGMSLRTATAPSLWSLIVYQALVPILCEHCRNPANDVIPELMEFIRVRFGISTDGMYVQNNDGCPHCKHMGTTGVTVVAEMMVPTRDILLALRAGNEYEAEKLWRSTSDGKFDSENLRGKTVFEHALYKAYLGLIDPRECEEFEAFERYEFVDGRHMEVEGFQE